jgi:hypothetical protein
MAHAPIEYSLILRKIKRRARPNDSLSNADVCKNVCAAEGILRSSNQNMPSRALTFRELGAATDGFSERNLLGEGGFGRVYKGVLGDTKEVIAVKQLDRDGFQGNREFLVEVLMLSLLHHPNLVKLLGYCTDSDQRILVYEYMPKGSLEDHLLGTHISSIPESPVWLCRRVLSVLIHGCINGKQICLQTGSHCRGTRGCRSRLVPQRASSTCTRWPTRR